jgi:hypothetical protein
MSEAGRFAGLKAGYAASVSGRKGFMTFVEASVKLFGWGSLVVGTWGLIHPKSLTDLFGDQPELGRRLGARDVAVGMALLTIPGPLPLGLRMASDVHDAIRLRQRSPLVAAGAALVALWGAGAIAGSLSAARTGAGRRPESLGSEVAAH